MSFEIPSMAPAIPEIFLLSMACVILIVDLFLSDKSRIVTYLLAQLTLLGALFLTLNSTSTETILTFSNTFVRDTMSDILKVAIYIATFITFMYAKDYLRDRGIFKGEFYVLGLFGALGMMILVSAHNFYEI